jgi:hypothetical protein
VKAIERLGFLEPVLEREAAPLEDVAFRLFPPGELPEEWSTALLAGPEGCDKLESFVGKLCRMQDNLAGKYLPLLPEAREEPVGTAIDNLARAERLDWLEDAARRRRMRRARNGLVHEYSSDPADMLSALGEARAFVAHLIGAWRRMRDYATTLRENDV